MTTRRTGQFTGYKLNEYGSARKLPDWLLVDTPANEHYEWIPKF